MASLMISESPTLMLRHNTLPWTSLRTRARIRTDKTRLRPRNHLAVKSVPFTAVLVELGRRRDGRQEPAPNRDRPAPSHNPRSIPPAASDPRADKIEPY